LAKRHRIVHRLFSRNRAECSLAETGRAVIHLCQVPKVAVTAQAVAAKRNDGAPEEIVGRVSLEPHVTAATWQVDRAIPEA
jgi:hypothetical protein